MKLNYCGILKTNKKVALNVAIILFVAFLFIRSFFIETDQKVFEGGLKNIQEEQFQGIVADKKFEKFNHNASVIYLKNTTKVAIFGEFWSKIMIGDSLEKKRGETIITVYRNNEKFILDNKEILDRFKK
ncbi:hypothetical protein D0809_08610 [Flavobacterium circumlabens]|uniref:Uncharacterized protein n=1 Tax=Flavobacterium circumlabens TaxID=2133765 RepID=A0A4Y7UFM3_9FLAO|nr:hypothetical protein [Flavobacterium circumlabens]TCN59977.1 hypothetical protein EV142_102597 [Flavobacterium circumlabens]TEB45217.1 hypothetical protein D0809_08610 [Flavobacterium circumlabens]